MIIKQNIPSLRTHVSLTRSDRRGALSMQRLSMGTRINTAKDDPAGLSIANRFRREITGLANASQNSLDGASLIQTVDGALNEVHAILERIRQLTVQGANDTATDSDRVAFQDEIEQLLDEVENIGRTTQFNGRNVFAGRFTQEVHGYSPQVVHGRVTVRTNTRKDNLLHMNIPRLSIFDNGNPLHDSALHGNITGPVFDLHGNRKGTPVVDSAGQPTGGYRLTLAEAFHRDHGGSVWQFDPQRPIMENNPLFVDPVTTPAEPQFIQSTDDNGNPLFHTAESGVWLSRSLNLLDQSIRQVSDMRSKMGAYQNRLEQTSVVLDVTGINMQSALSRIVDTDMALEMSELHRQNVITQGAISVMGMANQRPQQMLSLMNF